MPGDKKFIMIKPIEDKGGISKSKEEERAFKQKVSVTRSSGDVEDDWEVISVGDGKVVVEKEDPKSGERLRKVLPENEVKIIDNEDNDKKIKAPELGLTISCQNCGRIQNAEAVFCGSCGKRLKTKDAAAIKLTEDEFNNELKKDAQKWERGKEKLPDYVQPSLDEEHMFCPYCGKRIGREAKFCNFCGEKVPDYDSVMAEQAPDAAELMDKALVNIKRIQGLEKNQKDPEFGDSLPREFYELDPLQQEKIKQDLKRRIVDIVKSDAQTRYSEDLKQKMATLTPSSGLLNKGKGILKRFGAGLKASITKDMELKNIEAQVFKELKTTWEGQDLIRKDAELLTANVSKQKIVKEDGRLMVAYVDFTKMENLTAEEVTDFQNFNKFANDFSQIPYEWGLEKKGKNKENYDNARKEYFTARKELLSKLNNRVGGVEAMTQVAEIDSAIQIEQLLNTHPEVDKALNDFKKGADYKDAAKTGLTAINTLTGKNAVNRGLIAGGALLRTGAKVLPWMAGASSATMAASTFGVGAVSGGAIGGIRGYLRARGEIIEKAKNARYGKGDGATAKIKTEGYTVNKKGKLVVETRKVEKQMVAITDSKHLYERLDKLMKEIDSMDLDDEKRSEKLGLLSARIEHTFGKIEKGQVNFGNSRTALSNQFDLMNSLNTAVALKEVNSKEMQPEIKARIDSMLESVAGNNAENISKSQSKFITKQTWKGIALGAGLASAGNVIRYAGDYIYTSFSGGSGASAVEQLSPASGKTDEELANDILGKETPGVAPKAPTDVTLDTPKLNSVIENSVVHKGQGIENAFIKQIEGNPKLAQELGFKGDINDSKALHAFAQNEAHSVALKTGYADGAGNQVRVSKADSVAYELKMENGKIVVDEKTLDGKLIETNHEGDKFSENINDYEYAKNAKTPVQHTRIIEHHTVKHQSEHHISKPRHEMTQRPIQHEPKAHVQPEVPGQKPLAPGEVRIGKTVKIGSTVSVGETRPIGSTVFIGDTATIGGNPKVISTPNNIHTPEPSIDKPTVTEKVPAAASDAPVIESKHTPNPDTTPAKPTPTPDEIKAKEIKADIETKMGAGKDIDTKLKGTTFSENQYNLTIDQLNKVAVTYDKNVEIIGTKTWEFEKSGWAKNFINAELNDPALKTDKTVMYLNSLFKATKLNPEVDTVLGVTRNESIEHYVSRALQAAAKEGKLEQIKIIE